MQRKNELVVSQNALNVVAGLLLVVGLMMVGSSVSGSASGDLMVLAGLVIGWYLTYINRNSRTFYWYARLFFVGYLSFVFVYNFSSVVFGY